MVPVVAVSTTEAMVSPEVPTAPENVVPPEFVTVSVPDVCSDCPADGDGACDVDCDGSTRCQEAVPAMLEG
jgi:hypothetical protein